MAKVTMNQTKHHKRILLCAGSGAAVLAGVVGIAFSHASAATQSSPVSITLHSMVRPLCSISVTTTPQATSIDLSTPQANLAIATVTESCNGNGYTVTVASQNGQVRGQPAMIGTILDGAISYAVLYDGAQVSFNGGSAVAVDTSAHTPLTRRTVGIAFSGNPNLPSDSYQDTLTFSILGK
jgi:hypothetical protein